MAKMVYQEADYCFTAEDNSVLLDIEGYGRFVEDCRKLIQEDREASKLARQELVGKSPWRPTPKELAQLRDDLAMTINKDLEQTIENILKKNK